MRSLALDQIQYQPLPVDREIPEIRIRGTIAIHAEEAHSLRAVANTPELLTKELGQRIRDRIGYALYKQQRDGLNALRSAFRDFRLTVQPSNWSTTNEKLKAFEQALAALEESMT